MLRWNVRLPTLLLILPLSLAILSGPALADKRVALVIGNDRYPNLPAEQQLLKAGNDADSVGNAFTSMGFDVIRGKNLGRQGIIDRLSELTASVGPGDTVALFYAGHGVAIGGVNYVVPSDVPTVTPDAEGRVRGASISEPDIITEIQSKGVRVAFVVIDACRDNPFPRTGTRSIGNTRGLADSKPARGVFTIYSAGIGQTALDRLEPDDRNPNSVFTRVFVQELKRPGLHLGNLAVEVREKVADIALKARNERGEVTPHEQTPAYYDQTIGGRVYLVGVSAAAKDEPKPPPAPSPDPAAQAWGATQSTTSAAVLEDFIRQFDGTPYSSMARARLVEIRAAENRQQKAATAASPVPAPPASTQLAAVSPAAAPPAAGSGGSSQVFTTRPVAVSPGAPPPTNFPTKPVTINVPFPPGGPTDIVARLIAAEMARTLGQPVVINNIGGAGGMIGITATAKAAADGYTIVVGSLGTLASGLAAKDFDPTGGLDTIGLISASPMMIAAKRNFPDLNALRSYIRQGNAMFGSAGSGSTSHLGCTQFNSLIGANAKHIPYRGMAPALADLAAGQTDFVCGDASSFKSAADSGSVKILVAASAERLSWLPNVPTTTEAGLPAFRASSWTALFAPKGTPRPVIEKLNYALGRAINDPSTRAKLDQIGFDEMPSANYLSPQAGHAFVRAEASRWKPIVKSAMIQ